MKNNLINCCNNIQSFSNLVNYLESYPNFHIFENVWFELEVINAVALDEWCESGSPKLWDKWDKKYKKKAVSLVKQINYLMKNSLIYCCDSVQLYSHLVNYLKFHPNFYVFEHIWFELELINNFALEEWFTAGSPQLWSNWDNKYRKEAVIFVDELSLLI